MAKAKARPRGRRPKQMRIPSMEPESIREIDDAAETYHEAKTERVRLSREEDEAKDNLIDKMKQHGIDRYETPDGLVVVVTSSSNVKTKRKAEETEPSDNGNGEGDGDE